MMKGRAKQNRLVITAVYTVLLAFMFMNAGNPVRPDNPGRTQAAYAAAAGAKDCADCGNNENRRPQGALCSLKFIAYFLWFSFVAVAGVIIVVMDLATGFSQGYTVDLVAWVKAKTDSLHRFFSALGCV